MVAQKLSESELIAIELILEVLKKQYGYDFYHYNRPSLERRFLYHQKRLGLASLPEIVPRLLTEPDYFNVLFSDLSITVTEMFRAPAFFCSFIQYVLPVLRTYAYSKIWHAGCSTGEEVYSMAILLKEHDYLERVLLYATDFNAQVISEAKKGVYPKNNFDGFNENYLASGGSGNFEEYFFEKYDLIKVKEFLGKNIIFSLHNLTVDGVFSEVEVIVCRNVMIYFDDFLKEKVLHLFYDSLSDYGFLCLGDKESLTFPGFKAIDAKNAIYQKVPR